MPEKTPEDYAWAAGLFDAEGYAKIELRSPSLSRAVPVMKMSMADVDAVERFAAIMKVGKMFKVRPRSPHQKAQLNWGAASRQALIAAQALVEFSVVKAGRLQEIIDHYDNFHVRTALLRAKICKITEEQAREIRGSSDSLRVLSKRFGISTTSVSRIKNGVSWAHLKD